LRWLLARGRGRWIFRQLTRPRVIRYFLRRTWGSTRIDTGLLEYDVLTARAEGAEFAPLHFLSGCLFAADSGRLYQALSMPVWAAHGVRGDFTNYDALSQVVGSRPWTVEVFPTGALPHFEVPVDFRRRYDSFIQLVRGPAGVAS
jgi:hypothetical protein